eukprot:11171037-Lingulodinium_polyedra.AAC.1
MFLVARTQAAGACASQLQVCRAQAYIQLPSWRRVEAGSAHSPEVGLETACGSRLPSIQCA